MVVIPVVILVVVVVDEVDGDGDDDDDDDDDDDGNVLNVVDVVVYELTWLVGWFQMKDLQYHCSHLINKQRKQKG